MVRDPLPRRAGFRLIHCPTQTSLQTGSIALDIQAIASIESIGAPRTQRQAPRVAISKKAQAPTHRGGPPAAFGDDEEEVGGAPKEGQRRMKRRGLACPWRAGREAIGELQLTAADPACR